MEDTTSARSHELMFALNETSYTDHFSHTFSEIIIPRMLLQFAVLLPFHIPVPDNTCLTLGADDHSLCTFHLSSVHHNQAITAGIISEEPIEFPMRKSRVEMVFTSDNLIELDSENDSLSHYFDILLDGLNALIESYIVLKRDVRACRVTKEMLEFACVYRLIDLVPWQELTMGLFLLNTNAPSERAELSERDLDEWVWYTKVISRGENPFVVAVEMSLVAQRQLRNGLYRETVVSAQTSVECFLGTLIVHMLIQEGKSLAEAESFREDTAFMTLVKTHFQHRLGGKWDLGDIKSVAGEWNEATYKLRNRVAHAGYHPSFTEASDALDKAERFVASIVQLVKAKRKRYPDVWKYLYYPRPK